jgi:pimeloyl-ACP methyl ester carboxylesterase
MPHFKTSGANIHYEQTGAGPDIVWIPGGDQRGREMRWQVEGFADFRNTTHDPRGVGETGMIDPPPWSILDMARDCAELIEAVCQPPVVVAGLSMGSMITQEVAINWPHLVKLAIPMGTEAYASGFSREWMESEIRYRREHGNLPPDFAMTHYGAFMYPSEVLGDEKLWNKLKQVTSEAYEHRDGAMLDAQWQACCLIATGGTAFAAIKLLERAGAKIVGCSFVIDLPDLGGADKIRALGKEVISLVSFGGH